MRCVCVITVTAPLPRRRGPRGISYDHPAASASLGTGDQTNRLPIALPIIGTIDTSACHRASPGIDGGRSNGSTATFEEDQLKNRASSSPGFSPVPRPCNNNRLSIRQQTMWTELLIKHQIFDYSNSVVQLISAAKEKDEWFFKSVKAKRRGIKNKCWFKIHCNLN